MNTLISNRKFFILICLTLMLVLTIGNVKASPTQSEESDFSAIDAYVNEQMINLGIPGMALGIVQDGQVTHLQGFGVADSSGRSVTPQTPFRIGSVTKSFTALAVMQLVEEGKIDLDAPVQTYLPWFTAADEEASAQITVRHLLNQSSGFSTKDGNLFWRSQKGLEETVRNLDTIKLTQPVGTTFQYSNINFMIAGLIVEKVSGQSYADYATHHIFTPLDMRNSYTSPTLARAGGLPDGHIYMFGHVFSNDGPMPPANLPAGALIVSIEDLAHYAVAQMNEGHYGESSILSPQGISELHAPAIPAGNGNYAMGWFVGEIEGKTIFYHNGDDGRFHASIILFPEDNLGIIMTANASGFSQESQVDKVAFGVYNLLNGKDGAPVSVPFISQLGYWGILSIPLLQVLGMVVVWLKRDRLKVWGVLLTVVLNITTVLILLGPAQNRMPITSLVVFYPELGYTSTIAIVLGIGWSVICTAMYLVRQRSK